MRRYLTALFAMLAAVFVVAAVVMPPVGDTEPLSCNGVADYPVQRLADKGDVGAMTFLGQQLIDDGCDGHAQIVGMQYLQRAAVAGHGPAQSILITQQDEHPDVHRSPISSCAALLAMVLPGVDDPHL
ncbi:MAG: hypothetical protein AAFY52_12835, partial [Pseudomonadota bacterium]